MRSKEPVVQEKQKPSLGGKRFLKGLERMHGVCSPRTRGVISIKRKPGTKYIAGVRENCFKPSQVILKCETDYIWGLPAMFLCFFYEKDYLV